MQVKEETELVLRSIVMACNEPKTRYQIARECKIKQQCNLSSYLTELISYGVIEKTEVTGRPDKAMHLFEAVRPFTYYKMLKNAEADRTMRAKAAGTAYKMRHVRSDSFKTGWRDGKSSLAGNSYPF